MGLFWVGVGGAARLRGAGPRARRRVAPGGAGGAVGGPLWARLPQARDDAAADVERLARAAVEDDRAAARNGDGEVLVVDEVCVRAQRGVDLRVGGGRQAADGRAAAAAAPPWPVCAVRGAVGCASGDRPARLPARLPARPCPAHGPPLRAAGARSHRVAVAADEVDDLVGVERDERRERRRGEGAAQLARDEPVEGAVASVPAWRWEKRRVLVFGAARGGMLGPRLASKLLRRRSGVRGSGRSPRRHQAGRPGGCRHSGKAALSARCRAAPTTCHCPPARR